MLPSPSHRHHPVIRAIVVTTAILGLTLLARPAARAQGASNYTGGGPYGSSYTIGSITPLSGNNVVYSHPSFFAREQYLGNGVYFMTMSNGAPFGYYAYLNSVDYLYHFDMGYEALIDAKDSQSGIYLYDFKSNSFFYTSPTFPFPYLYDFTLKSVLYYFPDPANQGRYNTNGVRYFYNFSTGQIITK